MAIEGQEIFISCSIGVVTANDSHLTSGDLLRDADVAMYSAKRQGRGRWSIFDSSMRKAAIDVLAIQSALRQAGAKKRFFGAISAGLLRAPRYSSRRRGLGPLGSSTFGNHLFRWLYTHRRGFTDAPINLPRVSGKSKIHPANIVIR
jgi:hypothetical protein